MRKKACLLVCGGVMQIPAIEIAQELGYWVINTDRNPECPGFKVADENVRMSTYDVSGHVNLAEVLAATYNLRGIFTVGADVEPTVAMAAAAARCPGVDPRAAYTTHHKPALREVLDRAGIPNAAWEECATSNQAVLAAHRIGAPLVIKNTDGCASRGTTLLYDLDEAAIIVAFQKAKDASTSDTALIEEMFTGSEHTVETLMEGDRQHRCFITDRFFLDKSTGHSVESGLRNPSSLSWQTQDAMYEMVHRAALAVGIDFGAAKCDMMLTPDGPRIIEMTCRLSGGFDCSHLAPAATGQEVVKAALLQACGEGVHTDLLRVRKRRHAVSLNKFPKPGRIVSIDGVEEAREMCGVEHIFLRYNVGDVIPPYEDCAARPVWVIASWDTPAYAYQNAEVALERIVFKTEGV